MSKNLGKIVKVLEPDPIKRPGLESKQPDPFNNDAPAELLKELPVLPAPAPITNDAKLLWQAIYYVANNKPKDARKCLLAISEAGSHYMNSFQAKCWVKEEAAIQRRHPEERNKYYNKPMPDSFKLWETA